MLQDEHADALAASEANRLLVEAGASSASVWRALIRSLAVCPGDAGVIHLLGHNGASIHVGALYHPAAPARALMLDLLASGPHALVDAFTLRALQTGHSYRVPILSADLLRLWVQPEFRVYLDRYPVTDMLVVPMHSGGRRIGAVRVWREQSDSAYTDADLVFVEQLVDSIASSLQLPRARRRHTL